MTTAPKRQPIPFGKYLLLDRINIGGMAEVWRAKTFGAGGFERLIAIKRILPNIAEDEEFISMFIDEAKITVQLNHANIAQIYELANIANSYFIAMEYISGKDMRAVFDRCRKRGDPAPIPLVCYIVARCCEGLDYAHRNKDCQGREMQVVHRDVSPQNVLISYDGEVKVIDFGIAKAAGKATKTQAGILKGKFGYMSPEQIRGVPLDRRSDVFAIGICLYEMLTGERLFIGDSDFSVLEKVRKVDVLKPSHFNRRIPDGLEKIVMKALAKDVEDRYQYASELGDDLQRFLVTSDAVFGRKDLAQFMKATFAEEVEKEKQRLIDYAEVKPPDGMLLAAQLGFGAAGNIPVLVALPVANPSGLTDLPTGSGPGTPSSPTFAMPMAGLPLSQMETSMGIPQIDRPGAPNPVQAAAPMPRLTAAPPATTTARAEHAATQLVPDGGKGFDPEQTSPGDQKVPDGVAKDASAAGVRKASEVPTDPQRGASARPELSPHELEEAFAPTRATPHDPSLFENESTRSDVSRPGSWVPPSPSSPSNPSLPALRPNTTPPQPPPVRRARKARPSNGGGTGSGGSNRPRHAPPPSSGNGLVIAAVLAVIVAVVVGALVLSGKLRPPRGLLMIEVPEDVVGKAHISVNGIELFEEDVKGHVGLITRTVDLRSVPAGKATVSIYAEGYEPFVETVMVKEGNEYTKLSGVPKKKKK